MRILIGSEHHFTIMQVNNVGRNIRKPTAEFTEEEFSFLMKTNVESVFHLSQLAYPLLKASGRGSIVFMSSVSSFVSLKSMSVQGATKGVIDLTIIFGCKHYSPQSNISQQFGQELSINSQNTQLVNGQRTTLGAMRSPRGTSKRQWWSK